MWLVLLLACAPCAPVPFARARSTQCIVDELHSLDQDGDGAHYQVDDCDDYDPDRFPGNPEVAYDGVDQDCDDLHEDLLDVDRDTFPGVDKETYVADNDADDDGVRDGDEATKTAVWPDGLRDEQDCDDEDATVFPDAHDPWGDGVDQDCDGVDGVRMAVVPP